MISHKAEMSHQKRRLIGCITEELINQDKFLNHILELQNLTQKLVKNRQEFKADFDRLQEIMNMISPKKAAS